ncbi:SAM-dependent methyltransferase [Lipingzhangella sp. LS1_29]|uniref:SAM-dependent methyltransferase n=1 Tax=Lipingzhangella rawalii TaxID=2055835 RepID=A0ABU2H4C4_9ACTN|nr:SAM-dependent methyltransferase [Lipingzhangella rawalii]MDS1270141.1 SAM-dependent methyltransferase [Lipingzhangella rawalii]
MPETPAAPGPDRHTDPTQDPCTRFMRGGPEDGHREYEPPPVPTDVPTPARAYGWLLGGKDNFQVDRDLVLGVCAKFPEDLDIARQNRLFLYRAVRYLARDLGITQFLDLGSGFPTDNNVHQVARQFQPDARVVYVDIDPIVLAHGRALLADSPQTTVITADMTTPEEILTHPQTRELIDFTQPLGILMFSIPHCIPDEEDALRAIRGPVEQAAPGSYLAMSHVVADDEATAQELTDVITGLGMPWRTRTPEHVDRWLADLQPVEPGLVDINDWRPDPNQPPLGDCPPELERYLGAGTNNRRMYEYGGVLRVP